MFLYLVQHGEAKREDEDPARGLSKKGRDDALKVAAFVERMKIPVTRILHSNKARAQQTAQILAGLLKPKKGVSETDGLAPMDDPDA